MSVQINKVTNKLTAIPVKMHIKLYVNTVTTNSITMLVEKILLEEIMITKSVPI